VSATYAIEGNTLFVQWRVDAANAPELRAALDTLLHMGQATVAVDLSEATYLSSSALCCLLTAHRRQMADGRMLCLCSVPPRILRILRLGGFHRVINIVADRPHV